MNVINEVGEELPKVNLFNHLSDETLNRVFGQTEEKEKEEINILSSDQIEEINQKEEEAREFYKSFTSGIPSQITTTDNIVLSPHHIERQKTTEVSDSKDEVKEVTHQFNLDITLSESGYPSECFIDEIDEDFICGICREVLRDPLNLETCPHLLCRKCTQGVKNKVCPKCRLSFQTSSLASIPFIQQKIINMKIKCVYHENGCEWTGTIGTDERNLTAHLHECKWSSFESCTLCLKKVQHIELASHLEKDCIEADTECQYCHEKMKRKMILIHESIGKMNNKWCENILKCPYEECKVNINEGELNKHLNEECKFRNIICYACEKLHNVPFYEFKEHTSDKLTDHESILKFLNKMNPVTTGIGSFVDVFDHQVGKWVIGEIMSSKLDQYSEIQYNVRLLSDDRIIESSDNVSKLGSRSDNTFKMENEKMQQYIIDCLKRFECTIGVVTASQFGYQPFYNCATCCEEYQTDIGCCSVCAVLCHTGHKLKFHDSGLNFCDCGAGNMKNRRTGKIAVCCAPKTKIVIAPKPADEDLISVGLEVRGTSDVVVNITTIEMDDSDSDDEEISEYSLHSSENPFDGIEE